MHTIFQLHSHNSITKMKLLHVSKPKIHYHGVHQIIFYKTRLIIILMAAA